MFGTMDAGNGESTRYLDPQLVTHLNLQLLAIDLSTVILFFSKFLVMLSDNKRKIGLLSLYLIYTFLTTKLFYLDCLYMHV